VFLECFFEIFFYIRSNIFSWFFIIFFFRLFAWLLLNLTFGKEIFGSFFDKYTKTKDIFERDENSCSKNFQNSRISLLCLEFSKANQTRRTRFWFIWYLFWYCNTFFPTQRIFFSQIPDLKKLEQFSIAMVFVYYWDIFRIIMISAIFFPIFLCLASNWKYNSFILLFLWKIKFLKMRLSVFGKKWQKSDKIHNKPKNFCQKNLPWKCQILIFLLSHNFVFLMSF